MPYNRNPNTNGDIKVYRPNNAKYAEGSGPTTLDAVNDALSKYIDEFGTGPREPYVIEVLVSFRANAFVMELGE